MAKSQDILFPSGGTEVHSLQILLSKEQLYQVAALNLGLYTNKIVIQNGSKRVHVYIIFIFLDDVVTVYWRHIV